jgi:hypothetical protein
MITPWYILNGQHAHLKALSHLAGLITGKRTKFLSVRDFSPVVNYTCPFAKNTSNVVSGSVPEKQTDAERTRNGVNGRETDDNRDTRCHFAFKTGGRTEYQR